MKASAMFLAASLVAGSLHAVASGRVAATALAVHENDAAVVEATVRTGLKSDDPRVRAVAARLAAVRNVTSMLNALRATVDREDDVGAGREEVRAIVLLGGPKDVDRALVASARFTHRLDDAVAIAAARLGEPALDLYFSTFRALDINRHYFVRTMLWGRPELAPRLAARLLALGDSRGISGLFDLTVEDEPKAIVDTATLLAAIAHKDHDIRTEALWHVVMRAIQPGAAAMDPALRKAIGALRDGPENEHDFLASIEMARRVAGFPKRNIVPFRYALAQSRIVVFRFLIAPAKLGDFLLDEEKVQLGRYGAVPRRTAESHTVPLPFVMPSLLPEGVAAAVMSATGCRGGWLGNAKVSLDPQGRVASADVSSLDATPECRRALETLIRLSIADNKRISAPYEQAAAPLVLAAEAKPCFDENAARGEAVYISGRSYIHLPRVRTSVPPEYPEGVKITAADVVVEAIISSRGCVRTARVVKPAATPALNAAALRSVSQWTFEPARLDSNPIEIAHKIIVRFTP